MKRTLFRLLTTGLTIFAMALFAGSVLAQGNGNGGGKKGGGGGEDPPPPSVGVGYRVFWPGPTVPTGDAFPRVRDMKRWIDINGNEQLIAVGLSYGENNFHTGFVYDYNGLIGQADKFWTVTELIGNTPEWVTFENARSVVYSFNTVGRFAGVFINADNTDEVIPFYFDLHDTNLELKEVPIPGYAMGGSRMGIHLRVNELGDILIAYHNGVTEPVRGYEAFIYNPDNPDSNGGVGEHIRLLDSNGSALQFSSPELKFNSQGVVAGELFPGDTIVRLPVGDSSIQYDDVDGNYFRGFNEFSEIACRIDVQVRRNRFESRVAKVGQFGLWTAPVWSYPHDLNNAGDVLMEFGNVEGGDYYLLHEGERGTADDENLLNIRSMLIEGNYSSPAFEDPMFGLGITKITDRDENSDFPWIAGSTAIGTNPDGSNIYRWFILIPEILP